MMVRWISSRIERTGSISDSAERGQGHAAAAGDEQLVVERMAQTRQHAAHRRLTEMDAAAGVGDAPLREQRVEGDEQVQIETV